MIAIVASPPMESQPTSRAARIQRFSARSCVTGLVLVVVGFGVAVADVGRGDESILAAVTLAVAFVGLAFGLAGLFLLQLSKELPDAPPAPKWAIPCGVASILGGLFVGLFALIT